MEERAQLYSVEDVAAILAISKFTIYRLIKGRDINAVRIGRRLLVSSQAIDRFIVRNQTTGLEEDGALKAA